MADEEPQATSLEDDGPDAPAEAVVSEPPVTETPTETTEPQVEVVDENNKRVPLAALLAERKSAADRSAQLEAEVNRLKAYEQFVLANPKIAQREPEPAPATAQVDPDAEEAARLMDFYKADGSLDVDRGAKYLALQDRRAQRQAATVIQPLQHSRDLSVAEANFQRALQIKDADGNSPSVDSLRAVFSNMTPADMADQRQVGIAALVAMGMDRMRTKSKPAAPLTEPIISEPSGGHPAARVQMSHLESRIARERGINDKTWGERTRGFERGRGGVLED